MWKTLVVMLLLFVSMGTVFGQVQNEFAYETVILDDTKLTFGTSKDISMLYDEITDNRLEITDAAGNLLGYWTDAGTTGNLGVTGTLNVTGATTLTTLPILGTGGTAGQYFRAGGAGVAGAWSALTLPNTITSTHIPYATDANVLGTSSTFTYSGTLLSAARLACSSTAWPVINSNYSDSTTNSFAGNLLLRHTTSGDMVDGFGVCNTYVIQDSSGVTSNYIGSIGAVRNGADNTGALRFETYIAGVVGTRLTVAGTASTFTTSLAAESLTLTTDLPITEGGTGASTAAGAFDNIKQWATTAYIGATEIATGDEIDTGTDANRAISPNTFVASKRNVRHVEVRLLDSTTDNTVAATVGGDFRLPTVTGTIIDCGAYVDTAGVTGNMMIDIHLAGATIMTTNKITIATAQKSSEDGGATQPGLTTTAYTANGIFTFDVDAIQTTPSKGLVVWIDIRES